MTGAFAKYSVNGVLLKFSVQLIKTFIYHGRAGNALARCLLDNYKGDDREVVGLEEQRMKWERRYECYI